MKRLSHCGKNNKIQVAACVFDIYLLVYYRVRVTISVLSVAFCRETDSGRLVIRQIRNSEVMMIICVYNVVNGFLFLLHFL